MARPITLRPTDWLTIPALAKTLLAEAGYPGGKGFPRFEYMFNAPAGGGSKIHENIAIELQQMWHDERSASTWICARSNGKSS
jgi:ABC-type transport system substrate-binding protein